MDSNKFMEVASKHIDQNFNSNNQLIEYVVTELNSLDLGINTEQAQHIVNIIEYVSKSTSKSTIVSLVNSMLELGIYQRATTNFLRVQSSCQTFGINSKAMWS